MDHSKEGIVNNTAGDSHLPTFDVQVVPNEKPARDVPEATADNDSPNASNNPWQTLATVVQDDDDARVKDALVDVESNLRFAGLFSVVLTGFVINSLGRLSLDNSQEILNTLRNIYTVEYLIYRELDAHLTSPLPPHVYITAPNAATPPFKPSPSDIRVGVLWCSSLIFGLVTASLGLVVKQWLREYLLVDNPSPRARLRIHNVRYQELLRWRVFKIASVLPLLLQVAFALFFVGLCYRTMSIHESLGNISYILVTGWAMSIITVTLLPAIFPRCPYKTSNLVHLLYSVHMGVMNLGRKVLLKLGDWQCTATYGSARDRMFQWAMFWLIALEEHVAASDETKTISAERADFDILLGMDARQSNDELLGTTIFACLRDMQLNSMDGVQFVLRVLRHRLPLEVPLRPAEWRSKWKPVPLDLRPLNRAGHTAIIDIISYFARTDILQDVCGGRAVTQWCNSETTMTALYILFSPSRFSFPKSGLNLLGQVIRTRGTEVVRILAQRCPHPTDLREDKFNLLVNGLSNILDGLNIDTASSLRLLDTLIGSRFEDAPSRHELNVICPKDTFSMQGDLEAWPWSQVMLPDARTEAARFSIQIVHRGLQQSHEESPSSVSQTELSDAGATTNLQSSQSFESLADAIAGMWNIAYVAKIEEYSHTQELRFRAAMNDCLITRESTLALLRALCRTKTKIVIHSQTKWVAAPFGPWVLLEGAEGKMRNLVDAVNALSDPSIPQKGLCITMEHVVLICYVGLHMVALPDTLAYTEQCKDLFDALARLGNQLQAAPLPGSTALDELQEMTQQCLTMVQTYDTKVAKEYFRTPHQPPASLNREDTSLCYEGWLGTPYNAPTPVGGELVEMLWKLLNFSRHDAYVYRPDYKA